MKKIIDLYKATNNINLWIAKVLCFLLFPLLGITLYGVIMRYVFNAPPTWGWQVLLLLFYPIALMGGGYILSIDGHIKLDLLYARWTVKRRKITDTITLLAMLLFTVCLAKVTISLAWQSIASMESYAVYAFKGPIWPARLALAIGVILLLFQGLVIFLYNVFSLIHDRNKDKGQIRTTIKE